MWVFLNHAMVSVVAHRTKPAHLLVRARLKGDLQRVFPGVKVSRTPDADYLYRAVVTRLHVAQVLADLPAAIDYPNFKGSISSARDPHAATRSRAYHRCWDAMMDAQVDLEPGTGGYLAPVPRHIARDVAGWPE